MLVTDSILKTFLYEVFRIVIYAGIVQGLFVVLLLNNRSVRKSRANIFLSILMLTLSFSIAHILFAGKVIDHLSAQVYSLGDPTFYLIAPLLWFYTQELTGLHVELSRRLLLHFLPFLLIIICSLSFHAVRVDAFIAFLEVHHREINIIFWASVVIQFSWYQFLVQRRWNEYQGFIQQEVSNTENVSISWVQFFMIVFLFINLVFLVSLIVAIHFQSGEWLPAITALIFSLSIFALGYKGILQKEVFRKNQEDVPLKPIAIGKNKINQELLERILVFMDERKPYLDAELTLTALAEMLQIPRGQLSQAINDGVGDNFYDFINKYRVAQVKILMKDPAMKNFNMLGIALEAGFKSKSTFNLIFKRFTGLTPTEYKKNSTN